MTQLRKYDLEERTALFGELIIKLCKSLPQNTITKPLIHQLIRSCTSIGANYMEANGASSRKDFRNKIFICKKETQETKHWLRMLAEGGCLKSRQNWEKHGKKHKNSHLFFRKLRQHSEILNKFSMTNFQFSINLQYHNYLKHFENWITGHSMKIEN